MNFTCPHCGIAQVTTRETMKSFTVTAHLNEFAEVAGFDPPLSLLHVSGIAIRCADPKCNRASVTMQLAGAMHTGSASGPRMHDDAVFWAGRVYPSPAGKPFPDSVPVNLLADYREAWSIINLSPKSAATLARRCLQGMIRDFCQIRANSLFHEIELLQERANRDELPRGVEPETIEAMRALKDVGNIGAHMTERGGEIVDVEPGEAEALLGLIEMLFSDWYVARDKRQKRLEEITQIAQGKRLGGHPKPPDS